MDGRVRGCAARLERPPVKIRIIEGEPSRVMSGAFLYQNFNTHDAVVIVRDRKEIEELLLVLAVSLPAEENEHGE